MKKKTSKILSITSLSIVGVMILAVILMAVIPTYKGALFLDSGETTFTEADKPDVITVRTNTNKEVVYYKSVAGDSEMYNTLWNTYIEAGSYKILDSIFIGITSKNSYPERISTSSSMSTLFDSDTEYCLIFTWSNSRTMLNTDGTDFEYTVGTATYTPDQYARAYISITSDNVINKTSIFLLTEAKDFTSGTTRYIYNTYLNTSNLYSIVDDLNYNVA